ncbi:hypothetical protein [Zunongwangia pacifica]|uniref:Uncharacterized protein n=1 Tax=Zunongwangia pacifica TaxID=2911062 RepID=A0A9X1ZQ55_9FLAO|nr:hypothetical protein [Zunongwangia pacifica]MCL6218902.1 hypothetical protein [Zunongwangia pacifica]
MADDKKGAAFLGSLKRNNDQILDDRAQAINEDAQLMYKREVEDLALNLKRLKRDQENMLDLNSENPNALMQAANFAAKSYVNRDLELLVKIRNLEIKLELAKERYTYLFGDKIETL